MGVAFVTRVTFGVYGVCVVQGGNVVWHHLGQMTFIDEKKKYNWKMSACWITKLYQRSVGNLYQTAFNNQIQLYNVPM